MSYPPRLVTAIWSPFGERELPSLVDESAHDDRVVASATHKVDVKLIDWMMDILTTSHNLGHVQFWHNEQQSITH